MQIDRPFAVITPTVDGDVLAALARADAWFTPPQLHRVMGRHSEAGVRKALQRLVGQGIVRRIAAGRGDVYELNRDHLAAPYVTAIAMLFEEFLRRAESHLARWAEPCEFAALFGSAASGQMHPDSDLDILVIRPDDVDPDDEVWRDQLAALSHAFTGWTGNDTRPLEMSASEVRSGLAAGEPVLREVLRHGIRLWGRAGYLEREAA